MRWQVSMVLGEWADEDVTSATKLFGAWGLRLMGATVDMVSDSLTLAAKLRSI
jgi:hypothetical protein